MGLEQKVQEALKKAMLAKDQAGMRTLRAIKSALMLVKTEKGFSGEITEEQEIQILQKMVKQRKESLDVYENQGREDLAATEKEEIEIIEKFLPEQLNEDKIRAIIATIIQKTGASSMKDMGKVMGMANKEMAGKADGKTIAEIVKASLQ
ncbi:MAG: GatB/YqeY domain-containing protein [Chitinophagales bacterium]|nr:GatB/YqeY domain-containing protein [Bacteroidota bacterium]MCB9225960.1 GatB/YqeY domain-containing protein [Chitinophagales bacterium]